MAGRFRELDGAAWGSSIRSSEALIPLNRGTDPITFSTVMEGATSLQQLSSADKTLFSQLRTIYTAELTQYQRFLSEQAKLRKLITSTVSEAKRSQLRPDKSVKEWIKNLQASTKPTANQMQDIVRARHRVMMGTKYMEWPSGGPDKWITEWQKLMSDCERWCEPLYKLWASDFNLVWGEVPGAQRLCDRLIEAVNKDDLKDWNIFRTSMELKQAWDQKSIRNGMRVAGRGRITAVGLANSTDVFRSGSKYSHRSSGTDPFVLDNHEWYWSGPSRIISLADMVAIIATLRDRAVNNQII